MVGLVIVSHSAKIAEGVVEVAAQMAAEGLKILPAGGLEDGTIGTDTTRILNAVREADSGDGVAVFADLGSAILSAETAFDFLDGDARARVRIADAPIVEGAVSAAIRASIGATLGEVLASAAEARQMHKV